MKKLALALAAVMSSVVSFATDIGTAAEFVSAMSTDPAGSYTLTADIDMTGVAYTRPACFSGTLDGQGHTITGLSTQFCLTNAGALVSVTFDGTVSGANTTFSAKPVGAISIYARDSSYTDVIVKGYSLSTGSSCSGLFTGEAVGYLSFVRCATDSSCAILKGSGNNNNNGGFIGKITGITTADTVFDCCTNNAAMVKNGDYNSSQATAGFVAYAKGGNVTSAGYPSLRFIKCVNNGSITTTGANGNMSGFVGMTELGTATYDKGTFRIVLVDCVNNGNLDTGNSAVSSACGFIAQAGKGATFALTNCVNRGNVGGSASQNSTGFVGWMSSNICTKEDAKSVFVNCANYGTITGTKSSGFFGGGGTASGAKNPDVPGFYNCANYGTITGSIRAGEFASIAPEYFTVAMDNCYSSTDTFAGVVSGALKADNMHGPYEADYDPVDACEALSVRAEMMGWDKWWKVGKASGKPELTQWSGDVYVIYRVRYLDWDDSVFVVREAEKGDVVLPPPNPTRSGYVFTGWDKEVTVVTEDVDVKATYRTRNPGEIGCAADFIADMANDPAGDYILANDIDFADSGFATVAAFSGSLNGAGHTISGVGAKALFGELSGSVSSLVLDGEGAVIKGQDLGALCNICNGGRVQDVVITDYELRANVANSIKGVGAFAGWVKSGEFIRCETAADVLGGDTGVANVPSGAFVARIENVSSVLATGPIVRFVDCTNRANVAASGTNPGGGGSTGCFVGLVKFSATAATDRPFVLFEECVNFGDLTLSTDLPAAGFVGYTYNNGGKGLPKTYFDGCENAGKIIYAGKTPDSTAGMAAGFVARNGSQSGHVDLIFSGCVNRGDIAFSNRGSVGGFVGNNPLRLDVSVASLIMTNCANYASVSGCRAGGFVGYMYGNDYAHANGFQLVNCANYGAVSGTTNAAEFVAYAGAMTSVKMENLFSMTTNVYDKMTMCKSYAPVLSNLVSAEDDGYNPSAAKTALNAVAREKGYGTWVLGKIKGDVVPELAAFCRKEYHGMVMIIR